MKKKYIIGCIISVIMLALIFVILPFSKDSEKVVDLPFVDKEMENTLINSAIYYEIIDEKEEFTVESLEQLDYLNIGYTGYYTTLEDVKFCKNIRTLRIGIPKTRSGDMYWKKWCVKPKPECSERILQIQEELGGILQECTQLSGLYICNDEGTCEFESLDFLKYGENLIALWLWEQKDLDYSSIYINCPNIFILDLRYSDISDLQGIGKMEKLETLDIRYTNVYEAGDIVNLKKLKELDVYGTPLAENEEELKVIREALPDVKINLEDY
ncbi:MAG: hypothetical protein U0L79_06135 [Lachnospiraceae bacterium]|nr:hypothetical protein [Lachnospiraceae bacterium]